MITSIEQCKEIQKRRVQAKKRGYAKAVRNFLRRCPESVADKTFYRAAINKLAVTWVKPEEKSI
jgi:hypothetical protein